MDVIQIVARKEENIMKKFVALCILSLAVLFTVVSADTGGGITNWGAYRFTQKTTGSNIRHSTMVQCSTSNKGCEAGSRTTGEYMGIPPWQKTTTTAWTDGYLIISPSQNHYHEYYGGFHTRSK